MQGNYNRSAENFGPARNQNESGFQSFNNSRSSPITAQPQHFSRSYSRIINSDQSASRSSFPGTRPLANYAAAYGQNIRPWLKMTYHSDENTRQNATDSVVINFDNVTESPTSHSMPNLTSLEAGRSDNQVNLSEPNRETNIDIAQFNSSFGSQNHSSNSNPSIPHNNEGNHPENSSLSPGAGSQSLEKLLNKYIPFITFLFLKAIYDHRQGILIFVGLMVTFVHANSVVKREIAKQSRRSLISLGIIFVNLFVSICFIYFVFQDQQLYRNLVFIPPYSQPLNVWDVLWIVGITDFVLKFITIQLKVGMACFPGKLMAYSARGKWYLMLERTSQLYRGLVPIQPWLYYLTEVYQGPESTVGMFFLVAYVVSKCSDVISKAKLFLKAFLKLLDSGSLGVHPSNEQLVTSGSQCPICHDEYNSPIILQCKHIFCESCVSTWFDREQTCPLCRAKIADDPSWRDGATSLFTQLF